MGPPSADWASPKSFLQGPTSGTQGRPPGWERRASSRDALLHYTIPMPDDSRIPGQNVERDGPKRLDSVIGEIWWPVLTSTTSAWISSSTRGDRLLPSAMVPDTWKNPSTCRWLTPSPVPPISWRNGVVMDHSTFGYQSPEGLREDIYQRCPDLKAIRDLSNMAKHGGKLREGQDSLFQIGCSCRIGAGTSPEP